MPSVCEPHPTLFDNLFPKTTTCAGTPDNTIFSLSPQYSDLRESYLDKFQTQFNTIIKTDDVDDADKHSKLACLMDHMINNIESTTKQYIADTDKALDLNKDFADKKRLLKEYENTIKNNENSGLVTDYRNESTEKRNKKLNTYFTLYVTFIVIFLIVEGIVFFV
tara:strand:+ start:1197 stop:1691 length:495 start_codon:yes stop_codon:yes gene_type:complete